VQVAVVNLQQELMEMTLQLMVLMVVQELTGNH
jgi:hypothetical protein